MRGFKVTASNRFFWQILKVNARDVDHALERVEEYLRHPAQQRIEEYEYQDAQASAANGDTFSRTDFTYHADVRGVAELDAPIPGDGVDFIDGGPNTSGY